MNVLVEHLANGLTLGALYASVAIGLTLVFGVVGMVNFSQADFFMLGSYLFYMFSKANIPYPVAGVLVIAALGVFGVLFEAAVVRPVFERPWYVQLISTLAASIILKEGARLIWGSIPRAAATTLVSRFVNLAGLRMSYQRILVLVVIVLAFVALNAFFQRTKLGRVMRAMSQNREACTVVGIDIHQVSRATFSLAAALAALGAALVTPLSSISPNMGAPLIMRAFAAVVGGGFGQVNGTILAAFALGIVEALGTGYVSSAYKDAIAFGALIVVLIIRPQGISGRRKEGL